MPSDPGRPIEAVIFDLGGVLIDWKPHHLFRKLLPDDAAIDRFLGEVDFYGALLALDHSQPFAEWAAENAARHPKHRELFEAYHLRWNETIGGLFEDTIAIVAELKQAGMPLYVISNWGRETWDTAHDLHDLAFLEMFDGIVISGVEGMVKPEPEIFHLTCSRHGLAPATSVFIDDNRANVDAAASLGFHAIHHSDAGALRDRLVALGLPLSRTG